MLNLLKLKRRGSVVGTSGDQPSEQQQHQAYNVFHNVLPVTLLTLSLIMATAFVKPSVATGAGGSPNSDNSSKGTAALEALNTIVQQHDGNLQQLDLNNRQLAEAIIQRLMVDNLTNNVQAGPLVAATADLESDESALAEAGNYGQPETTNEQQEGENSNYYSGPTGPEAIKLRKLLSLLSSYESGGNGLESRLFNPNQYPSLPNDEMATMKRATAMKINNYLHPQQHNHQAQASRGYSRNNFEFGLGKRPDSMALRFGDGGSVQPVGQFGKRPSGHRYDFGLGKRVANVSAKR